MNNESKTKSNNLQSFSSVNSENSKKQNDFNINNNIYSKEKKNEKNVGSNDWNSVPRTYDKEESMHEHEKTATNNQWCSTSK
ncbi:MAG: hypothetical protein LLF98_00230 [Clostridium sp.]|uniref:hypothetical protein n=1 Tax=Clostridium sp. TaxID=1506 RepID=UPI0025BF0B57|nr:hypothetical protein [Clostridium sp.]MCE5219724.1 hypothetical protein [Clostridium sp.]